jgi:predicted DsbA family dithiol-disulfide isomerase
VERLFALHFSEGGDLTDPEQLTSVAAAAGMDPDRVRSFLDSEEGVWEIDEAFDRARALGISGVPTFVFNERWAVQGAQRMSTFLQALEQAEEEVAKVAAAAADDTGVSASGEPAADSDPAACDDGVCAV